MTAFPMEDNGVVDWPPGRGEASDITSMESGREVASSVAPKDAAKAEFVFSTSPVTD